MANQHGPLKDEALLQLSSLGTGATRSVHERTPSAQIEDIVRRAKMLRPMQQRPVSASAAPSQSLIATTASTPGRGLKIDRDIYQRVLGEELRKLRRRRGLTRKELNQHLQSDISLQTLATYELGTRQVSVMRLVELCEALEELPQDLLARVHRRMFPNEPGWVRLDLYQLAADTQPELLPLRRWAEGRLSHSNSAREVQLDEAAIKQLAALCGLRPAELIGRLDSLASSPRR